MEMLNKITKMFRRGVADTEPINSEPDGWRQRSTEDLRHTLTDLMHSQMQANMLRKISADPSVSNNAQQHMSLGVALTKVKIEKLQRDTMIAMIRNAAAHPGYFVANALRKDSGMAENETMVRDVALFFDVLRKSGTEPAYYGTALSRLRSITKADNLFLLMNASPEYAHSVLRLVLHFTNKFGGPLDMDPALRAMVKDAPETADAIIAYAEQRDITNLEPITGEALLNWQKMTPPLRDGAL
jgi:hypothetical protein